MNIRIAGTRLPITLYWLESNHKEAWVLEVNICLASPNFHPNSTKPPTGSHAQASPGLYQTSPFARGRDRTPERQPLSPANREMGSGGPKHGLRKPQHSPFAKAKMAAGSPLKLSAVAITPKRRADVRGPPRSAVDEEEEIPIFSLDGLDRQPSMPLQVGARYFVGETCNGRCKFMVKQYPSMPFLVSADVL